MLNLVSMGLTGIQFARQVGTDVGPGSPIGRRRPSSLRDRPPHAAGRVLDDPALDPLAAFFSAVCLALAVLARSMKEGQYYMTPLYLIAASPCVFLTLLPGESSSTCSTAWCRSPGDALLLQGLDFGKLRRRILAVFLPVLVPTLVYAAIALRWAVDQFQREDVLFREAERFSSGGLAPARGCATESPRPTGGQATLCFALMLTASWFLMQYLAFSGQGPMRTGAGSVVRASSIDHPASRR